MRKLDREEKEILEEREAHGLHRLHFERRARDAEFFMKERNTAFMRVW